MGGSVPPEGVNRRLVTKRQRVVRPLGPAFFASAGAAVALLVVVAVVPFRGAVEDRLAEDVDAALAAQGFDDIEAAVSGLDVTLSVPPTADGPAAAAAVESLPGVARVETQAVFGSARQERICSSLDDRLDQVTNKQRIPFVGETTRLTPQGARLVRAAAKVLRDCPAGNVVVGGHTDESTDNGPVLSLQRARVMIRLLKAQGVSGDRLVPRGYGDQFPLNERGDLAARQRNQRGSISVGGL